MNIVRCTPFSDMNGFFDRYHRLVGSPARWGFDEEMKGTVMEWQPRADISETDRQYLIKAELPEVRKEDVKVEVRDGILTISGERRFEKEEETETQHRIESMYGKFSRSFSLPGDVDESGISAQSKDGVLKIRLPKKKQKARESVKIDVG